MGVSMILKRIGAVAMAVAMLGLLSACAGSVAAPDEVTTALPAAAKASLKLGSISGEVAPGVAMTPDARDRILQRVKAEITAKHPNMWLAENAPPVPGTANLKIIFTQYDDGNAFARFMLAGLGQIHIDGTVIFTDARTGQIIGQYKISKDFSFGGIYGVATRIEDVEKGFALSVAALVDTEQSSILARLPAG
jgi:hypothetical protein